MIMRQVIFVGGTSYSGSTFFDMILANDPAGFSCGEVSVLFNPYLLRHLKPVCPCGHDDCKLWSHVLENGDRNLYDTIFDLFPEVKFIVDSSKDVHWIRSQMSNLAKRNIQFKNILIWKKPLDLAYSFKKKNQQGWDKMWLHYHRMYLAAIPDWGAVQYHQLAQDAEVLEQVCRYLNIPYFPGKHDYWQKEHHTLWGNHSAKVHLKSEEEAALLGMTGSGGPDKQGNVIEQHHRRIYYNKVTDQYLKKSVDERIAVSKRFKGIIRVLEDRDVSNSTPVPSEISDLQMPGLRFQLHRIKYLLRNRLTKLKWRSQRQF